jgi:hypothetical protein
MNHRLTLRSGAFLVLVLSGLFTAAFFLFPRGAGAGSSDPGSALLRLAANFETFGSPDEVTTTLPPAAGATGGIAIYDKTVSVPPGMSTLYVTISAVGDEHGGARLELACLVDTSPCNPGGNPVGDAPPGWLTAMRHKDYNDNYAPGTTPFGGDGGGGAGDQHDNSISYTWCAPLPSAHSGLHTVEVRLASQTPAGETGGNVFLEAIHFFVDGSTPQPGDRCTSVAPRADATAGGQTLTNGG